MKFACQTDIGGDISKVVALWQDSNNLKEWQDGYQGMKHLTGEYNSAGSTYELTYIMRGKPFTLHETVLVHDFLGKTKGDMTMRK